MLGFTTISGNSSVSGARLTQVVTQSLTGARAALTTWEAFRDWIAQIFSCGAQRVSYNSDIIGAFSEIVGAQVYIDELENQAKRPVALVLKSSLQTVYDQALVLKWAADKNCPYQIAVTPEYVDEYAKRQNTVVVQDFESAYRLDAQISIVITRRHDNKVIFALNKNCAGNRFEMLTFPDPRTAEQRRIIINIDPTNDRMFSKIGEPVR